MKKNLVLCLMILGMPLFARASLNVAFPPALTFYVDHQEIVYPELAQIDITEDNVPEHLMNLVVAILEGDQDFFRIWDQGDFLDPKGFQLLADRINELDAESKDLIKAHMHRLARDRGGNLGTLYRAIH
jgi:hypothetical protein